SVDYPLIPLADSTPAILASSEVLAGGMRGNAEPRSVPTGPVVGIAADPFGAGLVLVADPRMDDREVRPDHPDVDFVLAELGDAGAFADQRDKLCAVEQRGVWIGAQEISCKNLVETLGV